MFFKNTKELRDENNSHKATSDELPDSTVLVMSKFMQLQFVKFDWPYQNSHNSSANRQEEQECPRFRF